MSRERYLHRIKLAKVTRPPFGAGAFLPGNVLLIGEQAARIKPDTPEQQPFCDFRGCSGWLNRLLEAEQVPEEKLFWINALNNDGSDADLITLNSQLRPSAVVALGGEAQRLCRWCSVDFIPCYHPQYWKRFKSKERYPLLDLLKPILQNIPDRGELLGSE